MHALLGEIVLHEGFLAATVPEVEGEVAEEFDMGEVDVDGGASIKQGEKKWWLVMKCVGLVGEGNVQSSSIARNVVAEDDASHGGLAGARLAHEEDLLLLGLFYFVADLGWSRVGGGMIWMRRHGLGLVLGMAWWIGGRYCDGEGELEVRFVVDLIVRVAEWVGGWAG